jgi:hypothetical protein
MQTAAIAAAVGRGWMRIERLTRVGGRVCNRGGLSHVSENCRKI